MSLPSSLETVRATHVRHRVVALATLLALITYMDRACIARVAEHIMGDLSLDKGQMGWVYFAFALAYALFEIPTAWWADRAGTRRVLTRIVVWWSAFTMATAAAFSFGSLLAIRFLFGAGEAGAWPSAARTFSRWVPQTERGTVQGIFFMGAHLGGGITPMVVSAMLHVMSWRMVFVTFGLLGLVWAAVWQWWFRDTPREHAGVNAAELALIESGRAPESADHAAWDYWRRLLTHRNILPLCVMYFPNSFAFYFCITWLPTYLREKHGFSGIAADVFSGLPLLLSVAADLFGGLTTDAVTKRFGLRLGRVGVGAAAYLVAGGSMLTAALVRDGYLAGTLISVAVAASMFTLGASWGTCIDIGGRHAGVVSAAMNTSGQIGSMISPLLTVYLATRLGDWNWSLALLGGLFLMGACGWLFVDPRKRVFD